MSDKNTALQLLQKWNPFTERVGLVLLDGTILELQNESPTPGLTFHVKREAVDELLPAAVAMWHTHPQNNVNLSPADYGVFLSLPTLLQYIVTEKRVRSFKTIGGKVYVDEADCV